jgi:hypothetical protein
MLSLITEKSNKKKKCVMENSPKIFKVPSLLDIVSAYLANEMLYEKSIKPRETGWYKSRWECVDRANMPYGCHSMAIGQWINGKWLGWNFFWHCYWSDHHVENCTCDCFRSIPGLSIEPHQDWILIRYLAKEYEYKIRPGYRVCDLKKTYDASQNVTLCTSPESPVQFKSKLFKTEETCWGDGWTDGFKEPFQLPDRPVIPKECLVEDFFPIGEMPATF